MKVNWRDPTPAERFYQERATKKSKIGARSKAQVQEEADDATQKVVEEDLKFDNANLEESAGFATVHNPIVQSLSMQSNHNSGHDQHRGVRQNSHQYQQQEPSDEDRLEKAEFQKMFAKECKFEFKIMFIGGANGL